MMIWGNWPTTFNGKQIFWQIIQSPFQPNSIISGYNMQLIYVIIINVVSQSE